MSRHIALRNETLQLRLEPEAGGICTALRWNAKGQSPVDILRPHPSAESKHPFEASAFALVPYSNRLFGSRLLTPNGALTLPTNHPGFAHPVHGLGWCRPWHVLEKSKTLARLRYVHGADAHWPFAHSCTQTVSLQGDTARFEWVVRNNGQVAMPVGLGLHPRLALEPSATVCFDAKRVWSQDGNGLPDAASACLPAHLDFQKHRPAVGADINHCYSDWGGIAEVCRPAMGLAVQIRASRNLAHVMVYRRLGEPWMCLEPVSHATGAFSVDAMYTAENGARMLAPKRVMRAWVEIGIRADPSVAQATRVEG